MGKALSKVRGHFVTRPLQRFNIETRTERILDQEKPTVAPRYESDKVEVNPKIKEAVAAKDDSLLQRLQQVYVETSEIRPIVENNPERPLPSRGVRGRVKPGFQGAMVTGVAATGKISIDDAQTLLTSNRSNPEVNSASSLSLQYGLNEAEVEKLLTHYRVFKFIAAAPKTTASDEERRKNDPYLPQKDWVDDGQPQPLSEPPTPASKPSNISLPSGKT